jgi:hypothetical protein
MNNTIMKTINFDPACINITDNFKHIVHNIKKYSENFPKVVSEFPKECIDFLLNVKPYQLNFSCAQDRYYKDIRMFYTSDNGEQHDINMGNVLKELDDFYLLLCLVRNLLNL